MEGHPIAFVVYIIIGLVYAVIYAVKIVFLLISVTFGLIDVCIKRITNYFKNRRDDEINDQAN